jgi:hypothetical protein
MYGKKVLVSHSEQEMAVAARDLAAFSQSSGRRHFPSVDPKFWAAVLPYYAKVAK